MPFGLGGTRMSAVQAAIIGDVASMWN